MNLCSYLERSAREHPDRIAVVDPSGRAWTYRELDETSSRVAGFLAARGVKPGDRVGAIAPKSVEVVATLFGIMKAGAAYVPADYTAPSARNRTLLADCAVTAVFLDPSCADIVSEWPHAAGPVVCWLPAPDEAPADGVAWNEVVASPPLAPNRLAPPEGLAYILYTSGSTGVPKGVKLTHRNATAFVDWCSDEFGPEPTDRFSSHAPFHFDLSVLDLYVSLKHGAALYLVSEQLGKTPHDLAAFIAANRLTMWYSTPSILSLLAQFGGLEKHDCSSLRVVQFAGEVFPVKHLRSIVERWPQARFYNLYGPTETNVCTFARIPTPIPPERTEPYPIGPVCPYCEGLVLDAFNGTELPFGEEGLLHIAGPSLFEGYWGRPTDELFFERDGRRWYSTGDVVREVAGDGYVYVGRRDRMVKRRGYRIELGEIERGLYQHERLREVAVIAVPDASAGVKILAYLTPQPGERPSIVDLKMFCGKVLPSYMNPDVFVFVESLPRTSTNKVDYQGLTRLHQQGGAAAVGAGSARP
jgi:amino acid adenylation domain-containing protein